MIQFFRTCSCWFLFVFVLSSGCVTSSEVVRVGDPRLVDLSRVRWHLDALNAADLEGRETGRLGGARAAVYTGGVLRADLLQPVLENEYRWLYPLRKHVLEHASLHVLQADTLRLIPGTGFVVDQRSGSGIWTGHFRATERPIDILGRGVRMDTVRAAPGPLTSPGAPIRLGLMPPALSRLERPATRPGSIEVRVQMSEETVSGIHVLGILPGSHPVERDTLVVVMARYDGNGVQGAGTWTNGTDSGLDAAVLLETARMLAVAQDRDRSVPQSVLVAFVSGVAENCQGLQWLERHMPWDRDAIRKVILLGSLGECAASSWYRDRGILTVHQAPDGWWKTGVRMSESTHGLVPRQDLLTRNRLAAALPAANTWIQTVYRSILDTK